MMTGSMYKLQLVARNMMCKGVIINADDRVATCRNSNVFTTNLFLKSPNSQVVKSFSALQSL